MGEGTRLLHARLLLLKEEPPGQVTSNLRHSTYLRQGKGAEVTRELFRASVH